jgi:hypothetical protein
VAARDLLRYWAWLVSGFLVIVGAIGLVTEKVGPLPTNRVHALGTNLAVGLVGFAFARFSREDVFVLLAGLGMLVLALLGFVPATHTWLYQTLNMDRAETYFQLAGGVVSLALWASARKRA